jgi:hypothetical protein
VNERIYSIVEIVHADLVDFLRGFEITLDAVEVLVMPQDEVMRAPMSPKGFGLSAIDAVRHNVRSSWRRGVWHRRPRWR